jgi:anhydro-N-acetylmuramic acid kinase
MSGTSMDGIDAALLDFSQNPIQLLQHHSHPIPPGLRSKILQLALNTPSINLDMLGETDAELGGLFADAANAVLAKSGYSARHICAIGSHGQTIRHQPGGQHPFTLQIGDPNHIAYKTGITTVADFRRKDMAAGGQGAPLVPAFHNTLFRKKGEHRIILNIGGIANITVLPGDAQPCSGFDTGPGNMLMDAWIQLHQQKHFDKNGNWAASSKASQHLVDQLMNDEYIHQLPPKSTGREHYHLDWLNEQLSQISSINAACVQASLCEFTARSIESAIKKFVPDTQRIIVCGGGIHNLQLMKNLNDLLQPVIIESSELHGLHPDWVEATAFAWLAKQTMENKPGNLTAVTGATREVVLGGIYPA